MDIPDVESVIGLTLAVAVSKIIGGMVIGFILFEALLALPAIPAMPALTISSADIEVNALFPSKHI
jgi:hypothetical protein